MSQSQKEYKLLWKFLLFSVCCGRATVGVEASDVLVQFARIELERPDALTWMQNGKFFEIYGDSARLIGRLLDLRVGRKNRL